MTSFKLTFCFIASFCAANSFAMNKVYREYCKSAGGKVEMMTPEFYTLSGLVKGIPKPFCTFSADSGFIAIGLETFSSEIPNFAATLIKSLNELNEDSPLWQGTYANPSSNVCRNLGGSTISFLTNGGFANALGQSDICVFGDGSMVSAWSLIYMANHREGYDNVRNHVRSDPLNIFIPQ